METVSYKHNLSDCLTLRWWWPTPSPMKYRSYSVPKSRLWMSAWYWLRPSAASTTESPWPTCSATSPWTIRECQRVRAEVGPIVTEGTSSQCCKKHANIMLIVLCMSGLHISKFIKRNWNSMNYPKLFNFSLKVVKIYFFGYVRKSILFLLKRVGKRANKWLLALMHLVIFWSLSLSLAALDFPTSRIIFIYKVLFHVIIRCGYLLSND